VQSGASLAALRTDRLHQPVRSVEQRLDLVVGERPPPRITLIVLDVEDRVVLVHHLLRHLTEALQALRRPAVPGVGQVLTEQADRHPIPTRRRQRQRPRPRAQMRDERLRLRGVHCHGYRFENSTSRRINRNRGRTVDSVR
jgi:hypothetical protein